MSTTTVKKWNKVKLGDIAEIVSGGTPSSSKPEYWENGSVLWATLPDLRNKYIHDTERKITDLGLKNSSAKLLPVNTVILSSRATIGEIAITKEIISTNQGSKNFICDPSKVDYEFFYYLLKSKVEQIINLATGATYKEINKTVLSSIEVSIPSVSEQKDIAAFLATYDSLIETNTKRIRVLEEMAEKIYIQLFESKNNKNRDIVSLSDYAYIHRGKSYSSEELSDEDDAVNLINLKCINRNGGFRKDGVKGFVGKFKDTQKVIKGDIVMAVTDMTQERMIVARSARVPTLEKGFGVISMDLVKIEPKDGVEKDYIYALLRWSRFADEVKNHANGANVLHLNPKRIENYQFIKPDQSTQKEFSSIVTPILDQIDQIQLINENLNHSRDLLIPQLVGGNVALK